METTTDAPKPPGINLLEVEQSIRATYNQVTRQYRLDDEIEVTTRNHSRLDNTLKSICRSFPSPLRVLDVGCGTGRYFHCLENVELLVGLDVSEEMLTAARRPVRAEQVTAREIQLIRGNAYLSDWPPESFHFIYSLGMFGHGCPVTPAICNRFHKWLVHGGKLLFNVVDVAGLPLCARVRRRLRAFLYPRLPASARAKLDARERRSPFFSLSRRQLLDILKTSRFTQYDVQSHPCLSPLWNGRHLECQATKNA